MESLDIQTGLDWAFNLPQSTTARHCLSTTTRYCICKLLRNPGDRASAKLLAFKDRITLDPDSSLDKLLQEKYPNAIELNQIILQLDYLTHLYTQAALQSARHSMSSLELVQIQQQVLHLLGFEECESSQLNCL